MHLCIFEDRLSTNFLPLTFFRPVYDLRCGILTLRERIIRYFPASSLTLHARQCLAGVLHEESPDAEVNHVSPHTCLFINGRCIMTLPLARMLRANKTDTLFVAGEEVVALKLSGEKLAESQARLLGEIFDPSELAGLPTIDVEAVMVSYPWDLVYANETELTNDFFLLTKYGREVSRRGEIHKSAVLIGKKNIHVGKKTIVGAGAVLDADSGPIYVGRNVTIHPNAVIEGPCFVGDASTIKAGARIYGNTSIGPVCKVGGEVEHSILHSYSNKQHDGFLGHSFLGPWVNLGAGTTTSNLKNTYGTVKVHVGGKTVDTGRMFVGLTAADHVKTGINATLDTGTVIGPSSNIYGTAIPPKYVPPFSWGEAGNLEIYDVERALAVAVKVMARRNVQASPSYLDLFRYVFSVTSDERTRHTA